MKLSWAQRVLGDRARARSIALRSREVGTTTRARLRVEHDGPAELPRDWFVKSPSRSLRARLITALPRLLSVERRFYERLAPDIAAALPIPRALATAPALVLEDLRARDIVPGAAADSLSPEAVQQAATSLARLHAQAWDDADFAAREAWLGEATRRLEDRLGDWLATPLMRRGLRLAGELVPARLHGLALDYARRRREVQAGLHTGPLTLVHHDPHPGNLFWTPEGEAGLLDWQLVRLGQGPGDLAYLLATSGADAATCDAARRRYCEGLAAAGVSVDEDWVEARMRAHALVPFEAMVLTLAVGGLMEREALAALIPRCCAALERWTS